MDAKVCAEGVADGRLRYTLGKERRICLQRDKDVLFREGVRMFAFPYRSVVYAHGGAEAGCRLLAIVPKRVCRFAVTRNTRRRHIRELFRVESAALNAHCKRQGVVLDVAVIVVSDEEVRLERAQRSMRKILSHAEQEVKRRAQDA